MNDFTFSREGWADYVYWQTQDRRTLKKINDLMESIRRDGLMQGIGKPEPLKHRPGYSRKIDEQNRIVYVQNEIGDIEIISCKGHYNDK